MCLADVSSKRSNAALIFTPSLSVLLCWLHRCRLIYGVRRVRKRKTNTTVGTPAAERLITDAAVNTEKMAAFYLQTGVAASPIGSPAPPLAGDHSDERDDDAFDKSVKLAGAFARRPYSVRVRDRHYHLFAHPSSIGAYSRIPSSSPLEYGWRDIQEDARVGVETEVGGWTESAYVEEYESQWIGRIESEWFTLSALLAFGQTQHHQNCHHSCYRH